MEVVVRQYESEDYDYQSLEIILDETTKFHVHSSDSPEDNNLYRNFSDCYDIPELLKKAYEAGRKGESFKIIYEDVYEDEGDVY